MKNYWVIYSQGKNETVINYGITKKEAYQQYKNICQQTQDSVVVLAEKNINGRLIYKIRSFSITNLSLNDLIKSAGIDKNNIVN